MLYSYLLEPIELLIEDYQNLVIIQNGSLHFIPFQAIMNRQNRFLVQDHNISYAPSTSVYLHCLQKHYPEGENFLGVALSDVLIGNNIGLPGTEFELNQIIPFFENPISAIGINGTETFIKKSSSNQQYIHLATHGFYNFDQPLYSFLLFPPTSEDDGRLTVQEILELDLNARLVTLSACETGLGHIDRGDELVGLSRAFIYAGSSAVIVSLWSVADYPTAFLMSKFYKYLKDQPAREALTRAQREVMQLYPSPLYWSPFVLIGNGEM